MYRSTLVVPEIAAVPTASVEHPYRLACEVADVLGRITFAERIGARPRLLARELAIAASWLPEEMPILNGELEWIAHDLE